MYFQLRGPRVKSLPILLYSKKKNKINKLFPFISTEQVQHLCLNVSYCLVNRSLVLSIIYVIFLYHFLLLLVTFELTCFQCMHGPNCKLGNFCTVGRRIQEVNVLGGLILPVWGTIEKALSKQVCSL